VLEGGELGEGDDRPATRTAEKIMGKYFDGEPWVGVETPISSIDDKVTQAVIDRPL
jgi:hypothetical protein